MSEFCKQLKPMIVVLLATLHGAGALVAQNMVVPIGDREGLPQTANRVERHGITWTFREPRVVGTFANGDPWVLGPVDIIAIHPKTIVREDGRAMHGSMIDPDPSTAIQGYDGELFGPDTLQRYDPARNVAIGIGPDKPLVLRATQSLISTESRPKSDPAPSLQRAAVLTCVETIPAPDAFRPPYVKGDKLMPHRTAHLDYSHLQAVKPVGDVPLIEAVAERFQKLWLDHVPGWVTRYMHPAENMPDYGRDIAALVGSAGVLLNIDVPDARKERLLIGMVQVGIDNHAALRSGCRWQGIGGLGHGRKLPILIAGRVLNDEKMLAIGKDFVSKTKKEGGRGGWFGEDSQTFYVKETSAGVWNWGYGDYGPEHDGLPEWGFSHCDHPESDRSAWDANPYRRCCSANAWLGQALAARMMGLRVYWNHDAFFDYVDRYNQVDHTDGWHRSWVGWHPSMYAAYRSNY